MCTGESSLKSLKSCRAFQKSKVRLLWAFHFPKACCQFFLVIMEKSNARLLFTVGEAHCESITKFGQPLTAALCAYFGNSLTLVLYFTQKRSVHTQCPSEGGCNTARGCILFSIPLPYETSFGGERFPIHGPRSNGTLLHFLCLAVA